MGTRLYMLHGGNGDETKVIPIGFGYGDEDESFL